MPCDFGVRQAVRCVVLRTLEFWSRVFEFINPELSRISLAAIVGAIRSSMLEEVDFRKEAAHIGDFEQYLESTGASEYATCPFVYKAFSSRR